MNSKCFSTLKMNPRVSLFCSFVFKWFFSFCNFAAEIKKMILNSVSTFVKVLNECYSVLDFSDTSARCRSFLSFVFSHLIRVTKALQEFLDKKESNCMQKVQKS